MSSMDMSGMDMSTMTMDASQMNMVFYSSHTTHLFSNSWAPKTGGQYAGTCIFLVILAIIYRALFVVKVKMDKAAVNKAWNRRYVVVADRTPVSEQMKRDPDAKTALLTANGVEESVKVVHKPVQGAMPWRFSTDLPRALMYTLIAGVGYLLMIAVMTQNIGYFLSILAGLFIGELGLGRFIAIAEEHH